MTPHDLLAAFEVLAESSDGISRLRELVLQLAVREALEEYELIKQNQAFLALTQEQNQRLQHLSHLLEEKVMAREKFLVEAREKLFHATRRTEALNRALVAIQKSLTKQDVEQHLRSIYTKLGVTSRSAVTRYAMEHSLV